MTYRARRPPRRRGAAWAVCAKRFAEVPASAHPRSPGPVASRLSRGLAQWLRWSESEWPLWAHVLRASGCVETFERLISDGAAKDGSAITPATPFNSHSYAERETDIRCCAARLRFLEMRPGSRAILRVSDLYTHWLLTLETGLGSSTTRGRHRQPRPHRGCV